MIGLPAASIPSSPWSITMPKIGIVSLGSAPGGSGGVDIYTRGLVETLASYDPGDNYYTVIAADLAAATWAYREWPAHVRFTTISLTAGPRTRSELVQEALCRMLGRPSLSRHGEEYMARQIDELGLDLLHYPSTVIYPLSVQTPCILTFFDMQHEYYPRFFTAAELDMRSKTYRASVEKACRVIVPSLFTRKTLIEKYATPREKIVLMSVGVNQEFGRADQGRIRDVLTRYGLSDGFIYYPAHTWPHKNHARLMASLRILRDEHCIRPNLVVSGGLRNQRSIIHDLAIAAGVEDQVTDLGFVPAEDLPALYSAASLMVFPSLFEGFGIPLVEAMACGCPIAAANVTAIPDTTNNAAILFDPNKPKEIADAIRTGLCDETLRQALVERGYREVAHFRWSNILPQLLTTYQSAVTNK